MRVYKRHTAISPEPYLDNCYIGEKQNELDIDATSPTSLFEFYRVGMIDYIQYRAFLKEYLLPIYSELTEAEQRIMAQHNVTPTQGDKDLFYTREEQFVHYQLIVQREVKAREKRWNKALALSGFELLGNQLNQLMMYNDCKDFRYDYVEADLPHIIFWFQGASYPPLGIDFTTNGFPSKGYYNEELKNKCLNVFLYNL